MILEKKMKTTAHSVSTSTNISGVRTWWAHVFCTNVLILQPKMYDIIYGTWNYEFTVCHMICKLYFRRTIKSVFPVSTTWADVFCFIPPLWQTKLQQISCALINPQLSESDKNMRGERYTDRYITIKVSLCSVTADRTIWWNTLKVPT